VGFITVFFVNAGVVGAKDSKTKGAKLVGDIEAGVSMETLRYKRDPFSNSEFDNPLTWSAGSAFLTVKHASKAMMLSHLEKPAPGGSIIATASVAGIHSGAGGCMSPYITPHCSPLRLPSHAPPLPNGIYSDNYITLHS